MSSCPEEEKNNEFLDNIIIPKMMGEHVQSLDGTIMVQEIDWAITKLEPGRSPGLDGLTAEFYKRLDL